VKRPRSPEPTLSDHTMKRLAPAPPLPPAPVTPDRGSTAVQLGKCARAAHSMLCKLGWHRFIRHLQHPSDFTHHLRDLPHPAAATLNRLSVSGAPLLSSVAPWCTRRRNVAYRRGPHRSAQHQFKDFLHDDMLDMIHKRYWTVLPYSAVRHLPHLKLAPSGVVPQRT
jgi:hypothetical protein